MRHLAADKTQVSFAGSQQQLHLAPVAIIGDPWLLRYPVQIRNQPDFSPNKTKNTK